MSVLRSFLVHPCGHGILLTTSSMRIRHLCVLLCTLDRLAPRNPGSRRRRPSGRKHLCHGYVGGFALLDVARPGHVIYAETSPMARRVRDARASARPSSMRAHVIYASEVIHAEHECAILPLASFRGRPQLGCANADASHSLQINFSAGDMTNETSSMRITSSMRRWPRWLRSEPGPRRPDCRGLSFRYRRPRAP
jgi:hypothetical protein